MNDDGVKGDRRTRKFAEVVTPQPEPMVKLSNRGVPTPADLGPLQQLLGVWTTQNAGWNMIALPFQDAPPPNAGFKFRVLMNQYAEELRFDFVDDDVPNRGLSRIDAPDPDQFVVTLDYQQKISQVAAEDRPDSGGLAGLPGLPIHHEPGLWLYEKNRRSMDDQILGDQVSQVELKVARLASIPHGNSVLALGTAEYFEKMPKIPPISGLPAGRFEDVLSPDYDFKTDPYLEPFKHYIDHPFMGNVVGVPGFPGFHPADMNAILRFANQGLRIARTTVLTVDSTRKNAGIRNVPFSVREAEPVSMRSTFWIQELTELDEFGNPKLRLQYSQVVMMDFFRPREDQFPGRAVWPHISIATLEKEPSGYPLRES
ncbi:MAG TPA: heme-binding protein [Allosphingosinicella sp.]|nr:heme-binding protein [Allosphingosinicella sp.]